MRDGGGPTLVEADTYRYFHQNGPFPGSAFGYRSKEEESAWRDARPRSPRSTSHLVRRGLLHRGRARRRSASRQGGDGRDRRGPGRGRTPTASRASSASGRTLWPDPAFVDVGIRGDLSSSSGPRSREEADFDADELEQRKFVDVVARRHGPPHGDRGLVDRRDGRGRPPAQGRHRAVRPRGSRSIRRARARHADLRERVHAASAAAWPWTAGTTRSSSSCTPTSCGSRPTSCSTRSARPATCTAATAACRCVLRSKVAHRHRLRLPALDGPGRHLRHLARLADRRAVHAAATTSA